MKSLQKEKLKKILMKNARLFQMAIKDKKDGCFMEEDFHLFDLRENEIFRWQLQITIDCATEGRIHLMMFQHPIVITMTS